MVRRLDDYDDGPQVLDRPQPRHRPVERRERLPSGAPKVEEQKDAHERPSFLRRNPWLIAVATILFAVFAVCGYLYWDYSRHFESTDDAFIESRPFALAPKVAGYLVTVPVTDNQQVAAGDVIARIDPRDYRAALEQATAQVTAARAGIRSVDAQIAVQQAQVDAAQARVAGAQAAVRFAQENAARYRELAQRKVGTVQQAQQTQSTLQQDQASLTDAQAALRVAERQIGALEAQRANAEASLSQAEAQRRQAELNLSYTTMTAAQAGHVVDLSAAVGEFVQPGTSIAMLVPDELWVVANFKETQLAHIGRASGPRCASTPIPAASCTAMSRACSQDRARRSRCCRRRTPPATS